MANGIAVPKRLSGAAAASKAAKKARKVAAAALAVPVPVPASVAGGSAVTPPALPSVESVVPVVDPFGIVAPPRVPSVTSELPFPGEVDESGVVSGGQGPPEPSVGSPGLPLAPSGGPGCLKQSGVAPAGPPGAEPPCTASPPFLR